jgi:signal transduction histidine kinase
MRPSSSSDITDSEYFKKRVTSRLGFYFGTLIMFGLIARHFLVPLPPLAMINFALTIVLLSIPFLIRKTLSAKICGYILISTCTAVAFISGASNGGMRAPATVLLVIAPVMAFFSINRFGAVISLILSILVASVLLFGEAMNWFIPLTPNGLYSFNVAIIYAIAAGACYLLGSAFEDSRADNENRMRLLILKSSHIEKLASLGDMSAGVAHEINNPLAIISGTVELLPKFSDNPEKLASKIEIIQKSCNRIARIVKSLEKFSRSDEKSHFLPHRICKIAEEVMLLIGAKSKRHSTPVTLECSTQAAIFCDEVEIEQVLVNLINNGIDAVQGKPEKWVKVSIFEDGLSVVVRVIDSGLGISEKVQNKLFEPFFTTKKVGEGTGLGLSISRGILEEHKATIAVLRDSPNTCFEIRFSRHEEIENAA